MYIENGECILLQKWDKEEFVERHIPVFKKNKQIMCSFDGMKYPIAKKRIGTFDKIAIIFSNSDKIHYICNILTSSILRDGIPHENYRDFIPEHYFVDGDIPQQKNWLLITDIREVDLRLDLFELCDNSRKSPESRPSHQYIRWIKNKIEID